MYCPLCGKEMSEVERKEIIEPNWSDGDEVSKYLDYMKNQDKSCWYFCPENRCFGEDYPLVCHHAPGFQSDKGKDLMRTAPGDSWSLTWLK